MNSTATPGWIARRPARWSMPVSLQPRAPLQVGMVHAASHRCVRESGLGYHLRSNGQYQLELRLESPADEPQSVSLLSHSIRCATERGRPAAEDGETLYRCDLRFAREDDAARPPRCWWSRFEPLVLRIEYADGREDFEQTLPIVITPRRVWALAALISSASLYGLAPWLSRIILDQGNLPAAWSQILELLSRSAVWLGLTALVGALWLIVIASDQLQLAIRARQLRREVRREVQRYLDRSSGQRG